MSEFVRASRLYNVENRTPIAHPAHQATDADVRRAFEEREIRAGGGHLSSGTERSRKRRLENWTQSGQSESDHSWPHSVHSNSAIAPLSDTYLVICSPNPSHSEQREVINACEIKNLSFFSSIPNYVCGSSLESVLTPHRHRTLLPVTDHEDGDSR